MMSLLSSDEEEEEPVAGVGCGAGGAAGADTSAMMSLLSSDEDERSEAGSYSSSSSSSLSSSSSSSSLFSSSEALKIICLVSSSKYKTHTHTHTQPPATHTLYVCPRDMPWPKLSGVRFSRAPDAVHGAPAAPAPHPALERTDAVQITGGMARSDVLARSVRVSLPTSTVGTVTTVLTGPTLLRSGHIVVSSLSGSRLASFH